MTATNKIIISKEKYETQDAFFKAVGETITTLLKNDQIVVSYKYKEALSSIIIEYLPCDANGPRPYWLWPDEADYVREYVDAVTYQELLDELSDIEKRNEDLIKSESEAAPEKAKDPKKKFDA